MAETGNLNLAANAVFRESSEQLEQLKCGLVQLENGAQILDFGVGQPGGIQAGIQMARICLADQAMVNVTSGDREVWPGPWVQVATDHPVAACMLSQYAGWPVKTGDFFAMGSGPMRVLRGKEELLKSLAAKDSNEFAVGTLECDVIPGEAVVEAIAGECGVSADRVRLVVAPTRSIAGCVQVVARSVETSLHKLHELGMPLSSVRSAYGIAPLPPPTPSFAKGIGRTNDAILYGAHVSLWLEAEDALIAEVGSKLPSCASADFGKPFAETFKAYEYDFYKVDPGLFSPAEVSILNLSTGKSWRFGQVRADLIAQSFGMETMPPDAG